MTRQLTASLVALCLLSFNCGKGPRPDERPNILILMADDWNWPHSAEVRDPNIKTPTFDRIAEEGVYFRNAFVASPSCTPSRAAMLTGMHPWQLETGVHLWGALPAKFDVFTDLLESSGYLVGYSGKGWGPGVLEETGRAHNPAGRIVVSLEKPRPWDSSERVENLEEFFGKNSSNKPFCLWVNTGDAHRPYEFESGKRRGMNLDDVVVPPSLPDTIDTRTDIADYYYEVERFDSKAGKIIDFIEDLGLLDNTIVVMTGDNGMPFPRAKMTLYDLGTRVPLAIRWPKKVKARRTIDDLVTFSDLAPTFLEAAGIEPPTAMSARSFLHALLSDQSGIVDPDKAQVFSSLEIHCGRYPMRAIRTHDYLYIKNYESERPINLCSDYWESEGGHSPTWLAVKALPPDGDMYQRIVGKRPSEELYAVEKDPYQLLNLADNMDYQAIKEELSRRLDEELTRTGDPRIEGRHEEVFYIPYYKNVELRKK